MDGRGVDGHGLLGRDVWAILEVVVLALVLRLQVKTGQPPQILLADHLVDRRPPADALPVVVGHVGPPVRLVLDVADDHVLDGHGHAGHLPGDVGLPAPPRLGQVVQDGSRLVGLHPLMHHVQDILHYCCAQLQVVVGLHALLRDCLGDSLRFTPLELSGEQVAEPALKEGDNPPQEEQPHAPTGGPEAAPRALAHGPSVEPIVDQMLEILAHPDLPHQPILVAVHPGQLPNVVEDVLQTIRQLEGIHVAQPVLHVGVHHQLGHPQDLAAQVEGVAEARLLALLRGQGLDGLQVEVVVQVQVVQVLAVDQEVQHVVALAADLQPGLHPVQGCGLEELRHPQRGEQVFLRQGFRGAAVELIEHPALQQLLVADAHFDRVGPGAMLLVPRLDKRDVNGTARPTRTEIERPWGPVQRNALRRVVIVELVVLAECPEIIRESETLLVILILLVLIEDTLRRLVVRKSG
mmetsp:Transcript_139393/g.242388  ORF Transcript_139393/g.242388 Transcript_139393/m.242388 type:complete len:464 (+) Transcript_139393:5762-7153(+)